MRYTSHRQIIDTWPSLPTFAADHGVKYGTAKQWRRRNSIPPERWLETIKLAKDKGIPDVTHKVLHDLWWTEMRRREDADPSIMSAHMERAVC
jgi:hypothetical protein